MNNCEKAPVLLFVYNRPEHVKQVLKSLDMNRYANESKLFIFSDGPKIGENEKILEVRDIIYEYKNNSNFQVIEIRESLDNKGLAASIIDGVTEIIKEYGKVIVLEDDLLASYDLLEYMNKALDFYSNNLKIWSIAGYSPELKTVKKYPHDIYMCLRAGSWGWATWKNRWDMIDWSVTDYDEFVHDKNRRAAFDERSPGMARMLDLQMQGAIDSWAIRWCYQQFKENMLTVNPCSSKIRNIGIDGSGTHKEDDSRWDVKIENKYKETIFEDLEVDKRIKREYNKFFVVSLPERCRRRIYRMINAWK